MFDKKEDDCRKVILTPDDNQIALPVDDDSATVLAT
jgi:hypothetical protein